MNGTNAIFLSEARRPHLNPCFSGCSQVSPATWLSSAMGASAENGMAVSLYHRHSWQMVDDHTKLEQEIWVGH